jgi:hypothetical protein
MSNNQVAVTAPSSTEYGLDLVAIATTTAIAAGGGSSCDATCTALRSGLVGYWSFNTDTDPIPDDSGNGHTGTVVNVVHSTDAHVGDGAYEFAGSINDRIEVADDDDFTFNDGVNDTAFTFSYWVKPNTVHLDTMFSKMSTSLGYEYNFRFDGSNYIWFRMYNGNASEYLKLSDLASAASYVDQWTHFAVIYDGTGVANDTYSIKIYINGTEMVYGFRQQSNWVGFDNGSAELIIGGTKGWGTNYSFNGLMDEFGVWNRALSETEVGQLYNSRSGRSLIDE